MEMTFGDYIVNPMGRKNMVYSNRNVYAQLYKDKLDKILVREAGKIDYILYEDKKSGDYFIHFKIPSEVVEKFYYDVVVQFYTENQEYKNSKTLKNYYVKFYSNDPAFVYTFAHAMAKNNLFVTDLTAKMSKKPLKTVGVERNPKDEIGYVKSLYFAYLTMIRLNLFEKIGFTSYGKPYVKKQLFDDVEHADSKVAKRQEAGEEIEKKKRTAKDKAGVKSNNAQRDKSHMTKMTGSSMGTGQINHKTKRTNMIKRSSMTKRTNRI